MKVNYFTRTKYHNKSSKCRAGHYHPSILEANYCDELALLVKAKEIKSYIGQVRYDLSVNGVHICDHIVDFEVTHNDGRIEVRETKGCATAVWKIKHKLFLAIYPDIKYEVIAAGNSFNRPRKRRMNASVYRVIRKRRGNK